jgi:hypothetical protein
MPPVFEEVELLLFDLHLSLRPLAGGVPVQPTFGFLLDREAYAAAFAAAPLDSDRFTVHALRRELKRNHFWRHYRNIQPPAAGPELAEKLWDLQIPFRCHPKAFPLRYSPGQPGVGGRARVEVFLWPCGWSSNVEIVLRGPLTTAAVRQLLAGLGTASPFDLDGQPAKLSQVFARLTASLKQDLYGGPHGVGEKRKVDRYTVVALTRAASPLPPFDPDLMADADRADLLGVLLGKPVSIAELVHRESGKLLVTRLGASDFALTDLDRRATLLAVTGAAANGRSRASLHCLAANVRTCALVSEALLLFAAEAGKPYAAGHGEVDVLREAAKATLGELPDVYDNSFSKGLFVARSGLPGPP